jgi:hypothetical protein
MTFLCCRREEPTAAARGTRREPSAAGFAAAILLISLLNPLAAQSAEDDARDARIDAILATPNLVTPVPQSNLIATTPGLEQQAPSAQFSFNFLAPFIYNSNAEIGTGGTPTLELSPVGNLSFATPLFDLPVRLTANMIVETDSFINPAAPISTKSVVLYVCSMSIKTTIRVGRPISPLLRDGISFRRLWMKSRGERT